MKTVKLGNYIERSMANNTNLKYGIDLIEGVNNEGKFCPPKANLDDINLKPYKIVKQGAFVYNPSRLNIGSIAYRSQEKMCIVSHLYVVFYLNTLGKKEIIPEYLFLYLYREEFFREVTYRNFGSQRPEFNFYDISEILIPLPDLETQKQIVASYNGLKNVIDDNMALVEPLEKLCHAYIVDLKKKYPSVALGDYIHDVDEKNSDNKIKEVRSVSVTKEFKLTNAKVDKNDLRNYLIVKPKQMAFVQTTGNEKCLCCAYNDFEYSVVVSSVDKVIESNNENVLNLQFLHLYLVRKEFDRYARYNSWGSAREVFTMEDMNRVKIPLPPIEVQQSIVNIYNCAQEAKKIANEAKEELKKLCPALVQFAAKSA